MIKAFLQETARAIPSKRIHTDEMRRLAWGTDAGFYRLIPQAVIHSAGEKEIVSIMKAARKYRVPLTFRAAGTSLSGQAVSDSVLVVAGKNWEQYALADNRESIRLQPGIVGERVNEILRPFGRRFPPDPASIKSAMVGGIVLNNASGMSCGIRENSHRMLKSARLILSDGMLLDTGDGRSRTNFARRRPEFVRRILEIKDRVCADRPLAERIRKKYAIKNVTGLNLLPFLEMDDPFDIIAHLIVGSEGTLAFLAEAEMQTAVDFQYRASAMLFFEDTRTASELVVALKQSPVSAVEFFDRMALKSVENDPKAMPELKSLPGKATSLLIKIEAASEYALARQISDVQRIIARFNTLHSVRFTTDARESDAYWTLRAGIFPSVGGTRPPGTTCLIEDVAFPMEVFADAVEDVRKILDGNGYRDAVIYGHALEGNYHFILNQAFDTPQAVAQYEKMMKEVVHLTVDRYDGSLKAEHGTGRNMAPFVQREWGAAAYGVMQDVKRLFDPDGILNPGVIFNDDPACHLRNIKPLPAVHPLIDKCIECGFCEVNCLSCGFTLSSRQRIVVQREIARLSSSGENPARLKQLSAGFSHAGEQTCAGDGLCAMSCPVGINTGEYVHLLREMKNAERTVNRRLGAWTAAHFGLLSATLKVALTGASAARSALGNRATDSIGRALYYAGGGRLPLWTSTLPKRAKRADIHAQPESALKVVYFPSCLNQMMGNSYNDPEQVPLMQKTVAFLNKAGYQVIFPENMHRLCCGTIWESKGMPDIAGRKSEELEQALLKASENGQYPVLCDQSPCLYRMRHAIRGVSLYEPVEFIDRFLLDRLAFRPTDEPVAIHATCSTIKMGLKPTLIKIAQLCSTRVLVPEETGCCGFAGDKGFFVPEMNRYALRKLRPQTERAGVKVGYSNSRTCEIGLNTHTGIPFVSIIYLVDRCTTGKI
ncbi:MAG: FAD-binding oxidoreductase [Tannerella sp.]|jgi:D-lactate dehydrogenase|nr:FAD-binding oxidoreductase [Tannerella sp.]